jgi:hypothetical protein
MAAPDKLEAWASAAQPGNALRHKQRQPSSGMAAGVLRLHAARRFPRALMDRRFALLLALGTDVRHGRGSALPHRWPPCARSARLRVRLCPEIWPAKGAYPFIAIIWPRHSVFWRSRLARRLLQTATPSTVGAKPSADHPAAPARSVKKRRSPPRRSRRHVNPRRWQDLNHEHAA